VTPHLVIKGAAKAIDFYKSAFGAEEINRMPMPDGRLMHACLKIGNSASPSTIGKTHATMHMYVEDVDQAYTRAVEAGATALMPPQDMFWGDRYGQVVDPFGQPWAIATHKEDLTHEEMMKKMQAGCAPAQAAAK